jgi:hypothetical protein
MLKLGVKIVGFICPRIFCDGWISIFLLRNNVDIMRKISVHIVSNWMRVLEIMK